MTIEEKRRWLNRGVRLNNQIMELKEIYFKASEETNYTKKFNKEEKIIKRQGLIETIAKKIEEKQTIQMEIVEAISELEDNDINTILYSKFISGKKIMDIEKKPMYSKSGVEFKLRKGIDLINIK